MIPDYQTIMLPVLKACSERVITTKEVVSDLADQFRLSKDEREQLLPSGKQTIFSNRVNWAKSYLKQAALVRYTARGQFEITDAGRKLLQSSPKRIDSKFLEQFDAFREFQARKGDRVNKAKDADSGAFSGSGDDNTTPDEKLRLAYETIRNALAFELLDRVRNSTPCFFEELIVELLVSMGYGGSEVDAGRAIGRSGDDGVDGVIDQDPLGVDQVYVQAKRYKDGNNIGAGAIRDFFGALSLKKAQKGIFFTSSGFSPSARETAEGLGMRIVLIDGLRLANLMIEYNIGCREEEVIKLKRVDEEYFGP